VAEADIVVGTHAVIQEKVIFRDLALAIIDEQHRFGWRSAWRWRQRARTPTFW